MLRTCGSLAWLRFDVTALPWTISDPGFGDGYAPPPGPPGGDYGGGYAPPPGPPGGGYGGGYVPPPGQPPPGNSPYGGCVLVQSTIMLLADVRTYACDAGTMEADTAGMMARLLFLRCMLTQRLQRLSTSVRPSHGQLRLLFWRRYVVLQGSSF